MAATARRWSPDEDAQLRTWPRDRPLRELAERLGRSYLATRNRYHRIVGLRRPPRRRPRAPRPPDEADRITDFLRLAAAIGRLRERRAVRGPLAEPDWLGVLLRAVGAYARRMRRLGQSADLADFERALLTGSVPPLLAGPPDLSGPRRDEPGRPGRYQG